MAGATDWIERDVAFAIDAARTAGKRLLALRESRRWEGELLGDVADQAADGYLQGLLAGRYPDDGVLSEETASDARRLEIEPPREVHDVSPVYPPDAREARVQVRWYWKQ